MWTREDDIRSGKYARWRSRYRAHHHGSIEAGGGPPAIRRHGRHARCRRAREFLLIEGSNDRLRHPNQRRRHLVRTRVGLCGVRWPHAHGYAKEHFFAVAARKPARIRSSCGARCSRSTRAKLAVLNLAVEKLRPARRKRAAWPCITLTSHVVRADVTLNAMATFHVVASSAFDAARHHQESSARRWKAEWLGLSGILGEEWKLKDGAPVRLNETTTCAQPRCRSRSEHRAVDRPTRA